MAILVVPKNGPGQGALQDKSNEITVCIYGQSAGPEIFPTDRTATLLLTQICHIAPRNRLSLRDAYMSLTLSSYMKAAVIEEA